MNRASPVDLRKCLEAAHGLAHIGIRFVPIPVATDEEFQALRRLVLGSVGARRLTPHITLAHPRNPKAPGNSLTAATSLVGGLTLSFRTVCRIQQEGAAAWHLLECIELPVAKGSDD